MSQTSWGRLTPDLGKTKKQKEIELKSKSVEHLKIIKSKPDTDFWGTPPDKLMEIKKILGYEPVIDYCGSAQNHVCLEYIDESQDALSKEWLVDGFGNFPYSEIKIWMEYTVKMWKKNNINFLALTFSKTGNKWWHKFVEPYRLNGEAIVIFQEGRLRFKDELGWLSDNVAPYDSAWIFYRKKT